MPRLESEKLEDRGCEPRRCAHAVEITANAGLLDIEFTILHKCNMAMTKPIAEIIWLVGVVGWYIIRHPFARRSKKLAVRRSLMDRREWMLLIIATFGLFVIPILYITAGLASALDRQFVPALAWMGVLVLGAALWLFRRSHVDLGRNWSISLKLRETHKVVKSGVYRLIRHPMYASFFLLGLGQFLLLPNWLAGCAGLIVVAIFYGFRVRREEQMMLQQFGGEYGSYQLGTKRIIPWLY
jgi:protein-S-isoprenylcysteine O-methyltransferase Ste14